MRSTTARPPRRYTAVLFDVGGTLLEHRDFGQYAEVAEEVGLPVDADALAEAVRWANVELDGPTASPPPDAEYWRSVLARALAIEVDLSGARRFADRLKRRAIASSLFSDVRRTLDRLTQQGFRLGAVSNRPQPAEQLEEQLAEHRIRHYFAAVVTAGSEGAAKPSPTFFERAAARLGASVRETFYVGDLPYSDARAARLAGLGSVWLNRHGTGFGLDPPEITSLLELPHWVSGA